MKNTISACLIVKNEEKFLANCLKSCQKFFDEIVVVDTGSTDDSINIAKKFTDKVFSFKWSNDFSKARNFSKSKASSNWIFHIDADEEIEYFDKKIFNEIIQNNKIIAFFIKINNIISKRIQKFDYQSRLFINNENIFWKHKVHEQVTDSLFRFCREYDKKIYDSSFSIIHYGYRPYIVKKRDKYVRNLNLLKFEIADNNYDLYTLLKYITTLHKVQTDDYENELIIYSKHFFNLINQINFSELKELKPVKYFPFVISKFHNLLNHNFLNQIIQFYEKYFNNYIEFQYLKYVYLKNYLKDFQTAQQILISIKKMVNENQDPNINADLKEIIFEAK